MGINQFWEYATKTSRGFKCEFCGLEYFVSFKMFQWHLAKIEGHHINICPSVVEDVQKQAYSYCYASKKREYLSADECSSSKRPNLKNYVSMGAQFLMTERFEKYINDIWSWLMDDSISKVGICGIGGVGKTEVAKYMYNYLIQVSSKYHNIFWVDLSPYCSIWNKETRIIRKLQTLISKAVGVDLIDGDNETERAAKLLKVLTKKKKSVVVLDDVWDYVSLDEVGIPVGVDQCTLLITTRSLQVCRKFNCQRRISIGCLTPEESYGLYMKIIGNETSLSRLGKVVSKSISNKCGGLPLAITITARHMRGITDVDQMRNAKNGDMQRKIDLEIFKKLKLSYDDLEDPTLRNCFLCCPLFVKESYETLMKFLVDEGIIKRSKSLLEELEKAYTMGMILQNVCLLEIDDENCVQMNVVIERMALYIAEEKRQRTMIIKGLSLDELPNVESWTEDLVRVSLNLEDEIESIPINYSPRCSKLTTLLLSNNCRLGYIADSFFEGLPGLKVLNLSGTWIESLPISLFGLVNLTTLILYECHKLRKIPSIAKLKSLEKLDLGLSGVEQVPDDIKLLSKLKHFDISLSHVKELRCNIFANLSYMRFLRLTWQLGVKAKEVACLRRLESLSCHFTDLVELNSYLMTLEERDVVMQLYVQVGGSNIQYPYQLTFRYDIFSLNSHKVLGDNISERSILGFHKCNNVSGLVDLQHNFQQIVIVKCNEERSFCNFSPIRNGSEFVAFSVRECDGIEFLFSLSLAAKGTLEKLEDIGLFKLKNLSRLFNEERGGVPSLPPYGTCFSHLKRFLIRDCPSIKQLFPLDLLPNLKNLEMIYVNNCGLIEEIFASKGDEEIKSLSP